MCDLCLSKRTANISYPSPDEFYNRTPNRYTEPFLVAMKLVEVKKVTSKESVAPPLTAFILQLNLSLSPATAEYVPFQNLIAVICPPDWNHHGVEANELVRLPLLSIVATDHAV